MNTLNSPLGYGADLYVNECQKIRHYRSKSAEERRRNKKYKKKKNAKSRFFVYFARCVCKIAPYSDAIHSFYRKSAIEHDGCF